MKIAIYHPLMGPPWSCGQKNFLRDLARGLARSGHEVSVYFDRGIVNADAALNDPFFKGIPSLKINPVYENELARRLTGQEKDDIYISQLSAYQLPLRMNLRRLGVKTVAFCADSNPCSRWDIIMASKLMAAGLFVDRIIVPTERLRVKIGRLAGIEKIAVLPMGIDPGRFSVSAKKDIPRDLAEIRRKYDFIVLFASSFSRMRGVVELLGAFKKMIDATGVNAALILSNASCAGDISDTPEKDAVYQKERAYEKVVEDAIAGEGLEGCVVVKGFYAEIEKLYAVSDLFVLPFKKDAHVANVPVSALEALACGACVAATRVDGFEETLSSGEDSFLVEDIGEFADVMIRLASDTRLRDGLKAAAARKIQKYDVRKITADYESFFKQVINER